jgi:hypothetical protein
MGACEECAGQGVLSLDGSSPSARLMRCPAGCDEGLVETRFIGCERCGTEGRLIVSVWPSRMNTEPERDMGMCPACEGECIVEVPVEPVTEEEIMGRAVCPSCYGTCFDPWHHGRPCSRCDGAGEIAQ